ncbi:MAG TPA: Na+/H+ antiporter NhaC family protein [Sedimentisphaerales bacterium]|nr:Na+/H+ antiporter NhaC family protein [Sedimentisphaerales bacterium]HRS11151.1 Na+/H+ antiporter NhaC family protein [Sedimentisphaerales bacterium]HRV47640.1 Na+/H+ antiporter NhaC family protein [Sedimentisphaerales bacterium]
MQTKTITRIAVAVAVFAAVCVLAAWLAPAEGSGPSATWYSIVPPLLAIVLAFLTHHVMVSLGVAILVGGLLTSVPQAPSASQAWGQGLGATVSYLTQTVSTGTNLLILSFIPPIFTMVEIIIASGGFAGIVVWLLKRVRSKKSAQLATAVMGVVCFIDDYANAIIVGSMMQPITDRFRTSRAKLAFLVDATSAPVSGLAVVSTWIAYEVGLFADVSAQLGLGKSGYAMFFDALSFRFYCLLMLFFIFAQVLMGRDFGAMRAAEQDAAAREVSAGPQTCGQDGGRHAGARAVNALLPLGGLVVFHITGLWLDGAGPAKLADGGSPLTWDYWRQVISASENSHLMLMCAALFGIVLATLCGTLSGSLSLSALPGCVYRGVKRALLPSIVLILAWSLKHCCQSLHTGDFLTSLLADRIPPHWFAPLLFIVASMTSFATGTSWGTMAILIPTAIPIAFALDGNSYGPTTMVSLGAVLDGAIFGDHCSPISDTTIISSVASSCDLIQHVRTQLPYSLVVAAIALIGAYIPCSLGLASIWGLALGALAVLAVLLLAGRRLDPSA